MIEKVTAVFASQSPDELAARYDDWAPSYEQDMGDHAGPHECVDALTRSVSPESRILDAGCGTGLAGQLLAARGYRRLEGLDISEGMLREAAAKGCYAALYRGTMGEPLDFETGAFDAVLSVGVFVRAHAPGRSLHELVRITRPGGRLVFTLRPEFYLGSDFLAAMTGLSESRRWRVVETTPPFEGRYRHSPGIQLQVWICEVLPPV